MSRLPRIKGARSHTKGKLYAAVAPRCTDTRQHIMLKGVPAAASEASEWSTGLSSISLLNFLKEQPKFLTCLHNYQNDLGPIYRPSACNELTQRNFYGPKRTRA